MPTNFMTSFTTSTNLLFGPLWTVKNVYNDKQISGGRDFPKGKGIPPPNLKQKTKNNTKQNKTEIVKKSITIYGSFSRFILKAAACYIAD